MATELLDFWVVIFFSLLGVILTTRLKLPSVVGVLFFGVLVGPHALGLVGDTEIIPLLSELGAILLLFFIGIEFNVDKILKFGLRAALVFLLKFGTVFLLTYIAALLLNLQILDALLIAVLLSFSSTAIFARLVSDSVIQNREETLFVSAVLIIEDIFAIFILTALSHLRLSEAVSLESVFLSTLVSLLILSFSYLVLRWAVVRLSIWLEEKNMEAQLFSALSLCALLSSIAVFFGLSPAIGAFLAGSVFSSTPVFRKVEHALQQLILLFSAFFFFSIGMQVNPVFLLAAFGIILFFTLLNLFLKFFSVSLSSYLLGYESRSAVFSGLLLLTISEFALLIAIQANGLTSFDLVSFSAALLFFSGLGAALLFPLEASINAKLSAVFPLSTKSRLKNLSLYMDQFVSRFEPGGAFYQAFIGHARQLFSYGAFVVLVVASFSIMQPYLLPLLSYSLGPIRGTDLLMIAIILYPSYRLLQIIHVLLGEFAEAFHRVDRSRTNGKNRMLADFFFFFFFFSLSFLLPLVLSLLSLPHFLQTISLVPLFISFAFVWDLAHLATLRLRPSSKPASR